MNTDWNVAAYEAFSDLRLRPALDLLARVFSCPDGEVIDLGCGAGAVAGALRARFPEHRLIGVDSSVQMLASADATGAYDASIKANIASWSPETAPAMIFSNAALHWLPGHATLIPRLFRALAPGGVLAVQMPGQLDRPSHRLMIEAAARVRAELFANWSPFPGPLPLSKYADMLPDAALDMWEAEYFQHLPPSQDGAHPVRTFVSSTGARPILSALNAEETAAFIEDWEDGLRHSYPLATNGGCWFPFRRVFFVAGKAG